MKKAIIVMLVNTIHDNGRMTIYELSNAISMPVDVLAEQLFELVDDGILRFNRDTVTFETGKKSQDYILHGDGDYRNWEIRPFDLDKSGKPIIVSAEQLRKQLAYDGRTLLAYHCFRVYGKRRNKILSYKKNGKSRDITAPSMQLKKRQRWVLDNILIHYVPLECVHGFVKGKSIKTNALCHINQEEIGCIDIKDFFPSINKSQVRNAFVEIGYSYEVADAFADLTTYNDELPQGAPTSPTLANMVFSSVDRDILKYTNENNLVYSRYADDITISGANEIQMHLDNVIRIVEKSGYVINKKKTHVMNSKTGKKVTGLSVGTQVKVPNRFKRRLNQEIYYCKKFGVSFHLRHSSSNHDKMINYDGYLYGMAYFIKMVEPQTGEYYLEQLDEIFGYKNAVDNDKYQSML